MGRYTEIPNRYPIFSNTDTDTPLVETLEIATAEIYVERGYWSLETFEQEYLMTETLLCL